MFVEIAVHFTIISVINDHIFEEVFVMSFSETDHAVRFVLSFGCLLCNFLHFLFLRLRLLLRLLLRLSLRLSLSRLRLSFSLLLVVAFVVA